MENKKKLVLFTHDGNFHADEIFARETIYSCYPTTEKLTIRTRDWNKTLQFIKKEYKKIYCDVFGEYDTFNEKYDHHQKDFSLVRDNGIKYATFGLVWKDYGHECIRVLSCKGYCLTDSQVNEIWDCVEKNLVQGIDASDNGQEYYSTTKDNVYVFSISRLIAIQNNCWHEPETHHNNFLCACDLARQTLISVIRFYEGETLAKDEIEKAERFFDGQIVLLKQFCPWQKYLIPTEAKFVIYPDLSGNYRLQCVPVSEGSFENKKSLPEEWGGLSGEEFQKECGEINAIFCHKNLFICGTETLVSAKKLALKALSY